ncbi:hypothetical protein BU23DRAFT_602762 [Bimuria novae-zelandiae CBS 107.79]|uniref:F-box domain-containing protein n=1 Tax=Bimuria novae-zelandiae CBS 107.79 TaxID=1447943 RepID=A0A6A5UQV0_9PLEO|nr:hypothetical protein BU23DRAFT_602762 [Bimuria novae-zelandiae CBS 107.79]
MNNLPQELVDHITSYLSREDLKNTLFLSRHFQYAAEQYSRAFQSYNLTENNANKFVDIYSSRRFSYLWYLHYSTRSSALDSNDDEDARCLESAEELESLDREFTRHFENIGLRHITRDWAGPRRDSRHDFGKSLATVAFSSLREVDLDFLYPLDHATGIDQRRSFPNLVKPAAFDPFSTRLRLLSYQLRRMKLCVMADETLLWPTDETARTPVWPNLESINVMFHFATPTGSWYFHGLPGVGSTEGFDVTADMYPPFTTTEDGLSDLDYWDYLTVDELSSEDWENQQRVVEFRVSPNEKLLVPFLTAFAKAAGHMPCLKDAALWAPLGLNLTWLEDDRQAWWRVGKWRPGPELHDLFRRIGENEYGSEMIDHWEGYLAGEGLSDRDDFEVFHMFEDSWAASRQRWILPRV